MERTLPLEALLRIWFSGAILDFAGHYPDELGLCVTLWSPSNPPFGARPAIFLPPGWQVSDYDRGLLDDLFEKLSGAP
jgi:hypothetical protein